jgi:uncharacterized protein (TIGR00375 family)
MRFIADLHIHSKYSVATSKDLSPENIWKWAQLKGITVIGTGDFTHPAWLKELKDKIEPAGDGLFCLKKKYRLNDIPDSCIADVFFLLSGEISCIYSKKGKTRKIHSIIFVRDFADAVKLNMALSRIGNLSADGRPILRLDVKELLKIVIDSSAYAMLVPAHAWTPHYSVFSKVSGFDSLEECFEELTPHVYAIETGLSSDPAMNRRLSFLEGITLISNSDAHSPYKIGREANIFDTEISYSAITDAIKSRRGFAGTIEFFPEEGKYYYDGHRSCGISMNPKETVKHNYICPVCGKKLTVGVMHRIEKLADRKSGFRPKGSPPFYSIIPLEEIIAEALDVGVKSKTVKNEYRKLLHILGGELIILMDVPLKDIGDAGSPILQEAISRMRAGSLYIKPGFDGEYGKIKIFDSA